MIDLMRKITGHEPRMWGSSLVGFDSYHYKYESGREGDSLITGFSPRKAAFTIYIIPVKPYWSSGGPENIFRPEKMEEIRLP